MSKEVTEELETETVVEESQEDESFTNGNFNNFKWDEHQDDETYEEFRQRRKEENDIIDFYLKRGRPVDDGKLGSNRREYLNKKYKRGTIDEVNRRPRLGN